MTRLPPSTEPGTDRAGADAARASAPDGESDVAARRFREAQDLLDEGPSAAVRMAILRAARAAANARAQPPIPDMAPARRPATGNRIAQRFAPWLAWRPSVPIMATMAVGLLAIALTAQVEREQAGSGALPSAPAISRSAPSAPPSASTSTAERPALPEETATAPRASGAAAPAAAQQRQSMPDSPSRRSAAKESRPGEPPRADSSARSARLATGGADAAAATPVRPLGAPPLAPPVASPGAAAAPASAPRSTAADAAAQAAPPDAGAPAAAGISVDRAPAAESTRTALTRKPGGPEAAVLPSATQWLRRIIALRQSHEDDAADRELARFSSAYPEVAIPPQARRP
jgi:hypothetical protein